METGLQVRAQSLLDSGSACNGSGVECQFYKLTDTTGIKVYRDQYSMIGTRDMQEKLAAIGLAPTVGESYSLKDCRGRIVWAYETEIVRTIVTYNVTCGSLHNDEFNALSAEVRNRFVHDLSALVENMASNGFYWHDDHLGNAGYNENDELVCIDCGPTYFADSSNSEDDYDGDGDCDCSACNPRTECSEAA